jgi:transcriptional regulator with XRE-family HTH domain
MQTKSWFTEKLDTFANDPEFLAEEAILEFTEKLVAKMQEQKISRAELAKRLDVSKSFITKLLNGNPNMTIKTMVAIAAMLDCRLNLDIYNKEYRAINLYAPDDRSFTTFTSHAYEEDNYASAA